LRRYYGPRGGSSTASEELGSMESKEDIEVPAGAGAGAGAGPAEEDDDEVAARMRARASGRGRRGVVFSEPVKLDASFAPVVVEKTSEERDEIEGVMGRNMLLGGMDEDGRRIVTDSMVKKTFSAGDVIIKQGDMGDFYYIISSGASLAPGRAGRGGGEGGGSCRRGPSADDSHAQISRDPIPFHTAGTVDITVNGKLVLQGGKGMGFGELALLYDAPRAATVAATSEVSSWAIDRTTFKQVIIGATMRKRKMYAAFLSSVSILATLTPEELQTVADALQPVRLMSKGARGRGSDAREGGGNK
jgi:cAMP-dependent protein kinase regulator